MGSDNLKELETWNQAKELARNFRVYVFERDEDDMEEIIHSSEFLRENRQAFIKVENNIKSNLSSSFARRKIRSGKSIKYIAPDEVVSYIEKNKLYR